MGLEILIGKELRTAVVGLGKMGMLHASILNTIPTVNLVAACDKSTLMIRLYRKVFSRAGITVVGNLDRLRDFDLDVVYVTTPISSHSYVAKSVYAQGIARNLFVEKTLASTYDQAKELCELARIQGGANMVGYMKRFTVTFRKAKDLIDQEILGDPISFDAYAYSSDFSEFARGSNVSGSRGGVLMDLGSHVIDLALWLFGDFEVESAELKSLNSSGSEDYAFFEVKVSDHLEGRFQVSWCMTDYRMPSFSLVVRGTKGNLTVNDDQVKLKLNDGTERKWYRHDLDDHVDFMLGTAEYSREDKHFIEALAGKRATESTFLSASKVDFIIDEVKRRADRIE
jgi:predicted dehydrogenase